MTFGEFMKGVLQVLGALGGVGVVAGGLAYWLGNLWAGRVLERQKAENARSLQSAQAEAARELERMKQEHAERLRDLNQQAARDLEAEKVRLQEAFERVRRESARELQQLQAESARLAEQLRSELSRQTYVHSLQFKKEFEVYDRLWPALAAVRLKVLSLRPSFDFVDSRESEEERRKRRYGEWVQAYNAYIDLVDTQSPFIPQALASKLDELTKHVAREGREYGMVLPGDVPPAEYWGASARNAATITKAVDEVLAAIRARIGLFESPPATVAALPPDAPAP